MSITKDKTHAWMTGIRTWVNTYPYVEDYSLIPREYSGTMTTMEATDFSTDVPGKNVYSMKSLAFDGVDEWVTMGNVLGFERTDAFSFSFWFVKPTAADGYVISKCVGAGGYRGYRVQVKATNIIALSLVSDDPTNNYLSVQVNAGINDGLWHHVAITYDGSSTAAGVQFYVDGKLVITRVVNMDGLAGTILTANDFVVGAYPAVAWGRYTGSMDEVSVYSDVLTAAEVAWIYNGGVPCDLTAGGAPSNLVGFWRMGDGDAFPTITDHAAVPHDGTMTNMEASDIQNDSPYPAARMNRSLSFDGVNEYVTAGNVLDFERTDPFSFCAWMREVPAGGGGIILAKQGAVAPQGYCWFVYDSMMFEMIYTWPAERLYAETAGCGLADGNWHCVAVTYDGSETAAGIKL
jgi:hypothetical protein